MSDLLADIIDIRNYTQNNLELKKAHHFLYDLLINTNQKPIYVVMGINPGENRKVWLDHPSITEETSSFDFLADKRKSLSWTKQIVDLCGTDRIVQSEHFFWSSSSTNKNDFDDRFGYSISKSPHLEFCAKKNKKLINFYNPKAVISFGFQNLDLVEKIYNLQHVKTDKDENGKRLIEQYTDGAIPWLFARHIRSFGFTINNKNQIKKTINSFIEKD